MKVLGIIVEYNPFHNGHIYHIQKAKEQVPSDYTIAVMSSSFVQRGEPAIIDKWKRSRLALDYGVDLVIELPFVYACQSADYFAKGAITLLNMIGVTDICFGSEDGRIETFIEIANMIHNHQDKYNHYVQSMMKQGARYADACQQALHHLSGIEIKTPNDLLGLSYVKEILTQNASIQPHCLLRTNDYHGNMLGPISSASAIRQALKTNQDVQKSLPAVHLYHHELYFLTDFFPFLKYQITISTPEQIKQYHLVEEGIENLLKACIQKSQTMDDLIDCLSSKRYTRPRIQRMLIHILMQNTKNDITTAMSLDYLRILAMNERGRYFLNLIKKDCTFKLVTRFSKHKHPALDIEAKATHLLSLLSKNPEQMIKDEYTTIPYYKV